ncbi:MAG: histidine kinase, partial [Phaeodactylibacter sp.]|nr:histidine kinase [Phaeodactylibacter sp.]
MPAGAQRYSYKLYTVDDGLPTNAIYGGLQDSHGYIWFYTEKGISRFNGYSFLNFTVKDGLPTNDIFMISEDSQGRLWPHSFGRRQVYIEGDSVYTVAEDKEPRFHGFSVYEDGQRVWFKDNNRKLLIGENGAGFDTIPYTIHNFFNQDRPIGNGIYFYKWNTFLRINQRSDTCQLLASNGAQLDVFPMQGLKPETAKKLANRAHNSFCTFLDGLFIQPFSDSIMYYLDLKQRRVTEFNLIEIFGQKPDLIRFYEQDQQLQVQSNLGVFILDKDLQLVDLFRVELPIAFRLDRIFKDREGNYWISSKQKGIFFLTAEERNAFVATNPYREADNAINCLASDRKGRIYAGTRKGTVYRLNPDKQLGPLLSALASKYNDAVEVKAMAFDDEDNLWIGRQSIGLERYCPATRQTIPFLQLVAQPTIHYGSHKQLFDLNFRIEDLALYVKGLDWDTRLKRLAVGRANYPFVYYTDESGIPNITLLSSQRTQAIAFGREDKIWMGHQDGLGIYDQGQYRLFEDHPELKYCNIWDVDVDDNGTVWIGTDGRGLFAFDGKDAIAIQGTQGDIIQDLFISSGQQVWIATNRGVKGINVDTVLENSQVVRILTTNSGLATNEANAVYVDSQFIYVGTNEGLTIAHRKLLFQDTTPPRLILDEIRINGTPASLKQHYTLSHHQNELEFFFTGLSYKSFGNLTYEYQLTNADKAIQRINNRQVRYTSLQPGVYTLHMKAIDIKGIASPSMPPLVFTIHPPWWQARLALICWILLAGAILLGIYRWRVRAIRHKAAEKTKINKRFAELELQALQSQMNPHFIFNSLGAIQYFIQSNDKKQADRYLSKFAYLMRLFLESSKNRYISLAEELKLIHLYVELEQLRFKGRFDFKLDVDEKIDLHTTELPTMLLQPFVENAINHGLFHKSDGGFLKLSITPMINRRLKFVIEDDGIGRNRAMK